MQKMNFLFKDGKRKALTFSYDDGMVHDRRLVEIFNKYQVKATFNLNSGELGRVCHDVMFGVEHDNSCVTKDEIVKLYEGHEIACHSLTHPNFREMSSAAIAYEVITDRKNLEDITGKFINGFAYPFGTYNKQAEEVLKVCDILYARTVNSTHSFAMPQNLLELHPTCHHDDPQVMDLAKEFCEGRDRWGEARMFYIWGHSFEFDRNNNWDHLENLLTYMKPYLTDVWTATNAEIFNYYNAYKKLRFFADGRRVLNETAIDLWFELGNQLVMVPKNSEVDLNPYF